MINPWRQPRRWHLRQFGIAIVGINVPTLLCAGVAALLSVYGGLSDTVSIAGGMLASLPVILGWYAWCWRKGWIWKQ